MTLLKLVELLCSDDDYFLLDIMLNGLKIYSKYNNVHSLPREYYDYKVLCIWPMKENQSFRFVVYL